jgi:hypothetical protein
MHDPANGLLRIPLPRRWVNKGMKKGRKQCPGPLCLQALTAIGPGLTC